MKLTIKTLKHMIREEHKKVQEVGGYAPDAAAEEQALIAALQQANRTLGEEEVTRIFGELMASPDSAPPNDPPEMNLKKKKRKVDPNLYYPDAAGGTTYRGGGSYGGYGSGGNDY